jgi:hypothetical protein
MSQMFMNKFFSSKTVFHPKMKSSRQDDSVSIDERIH